MHQQFIHVTVFKHGTDALDAPMMPQQLDCNVQNLLMMLKS